MGVMVAGLGAESSCEGRQGQIFVEGDTLRIRVKIDRDRVFVAGFTLFHTRIKGLTSLLWLPKIGKL
ncbi:hypothetical protein [Finegoldia magna]|uniref:hypothetical protein n=1 Tax=Finegoldia magna TaxID=1260 RepID=UPI0023A94211|nr:hypothetical protein [Finegoldia magna]MCC2717556.1 hypothetical protein [Finegoldia magna]